METYIPLNVTEATSGRAVTVYNQAPALRGRQDFVWTNAPELDSTYNGTDITLDKRLSNGWMMTGGVSIGETIGWDLRNSDLNNPNFEEFRRGIVGNDTPFSFRLVGALRAAARRFDERHVPASERISRADAGLSRQPIPLR